MTYRSTIQHRLWRSSLGQTRCYINPAVWSLAAVCMLSATPSQAQEIGKVLSSGSSRSAIGSSNPSIAIGPAYSTPPVVGAAEQMARERLLETVNRPTPILPAPVL